MTTTLITGASSGIGTEFARRFAARGDDVVLVARRIELLEQLAAQLRRDHRVAAHVIPLDLATPDAAEKLSTAVQERGLTLDALVNNAGFATHGDIADADPGRLSEEVSLNCQALVGITARFLPAMRARHSGTIINVASTAGFQPVPHMAVYSATKAFVLTFTEALWGELRGSGVRVLAVCPGATDTPFYEITGEAAVVGRKRTPRQVVEHTMRALRSNKPSIVDGASNALVARLATRMLPRRTVIAIAEQTVRPR